MWERGKNFISVPVEQRHIDIALARSSSHCTVAEAIAERIPDAKHIAVDLQTIRFSRKGLRYCFLTPHLARDIIINTDQGLRDQIKPTVLRMRPAVISKAGKKRNEVPSNSELRGSGLTRSKEQLHLDSDAVQPEQTTPRFIDGRLNPDRSDGLAKPAAFLHQETRGIAPAPRRKRKARAMVSTAAKGSVPTTLGGPMPPTSILSRREFGLRLLKR